MCTAWFLKWITLSAFLWCANFLNFVVHLMTFSLSNCASNLIRNESCDFPEENLWIFGHELVCCCEVCDPEARIKSSLFLFYFLTNTQACTKTQTALKKVSNCFDFICFLFMIPPQFNRQQSARQKVAQDQWTRFQEAEKLQDTDSHEVTNYCNCTLLHKELELGNYSAHSKPSKDWAMPKLHYQFLILQMLC